MESIIRKSFVLKGAMAIWTVCLLFIVPALGQKRVVSAPCQVSSENGAIQPGDLLVTSSTPGHAMRDERPRPGTIVGKALGSLDAGTGVITVLVTLQ